MRLVIAEKSSVARSHAALNAKKREDGFFVGGGCLVSWCLGHLAELAEADAYDEGYAKWRYEDLPILPESWRFTVSKDKRKQFEILGTLMCRDDV
jgi:DNA topoisomerase-3